MVFHLPQLLCLFLSGSKLLLSGLIRLRELLVVSRHVTMNPQRIFRSRVQDPQGPKDGMFGCSNVGRREAEDRRRGVMSLLTALELQTGLVALDWEFGDGARNSRDDRVRIDRCSADT